MFLLMVPIAIFTFFYFWGFDSWTMPNAPSINRYVIFPKDMVGIVPPDGIDSQIFRVWFVARLCPPQLVQLIH